MRYVQLPKEAVDVSLLEDATRRGKFMLAVIQILLIHLHDIAENSGDSKR